MWIKIKLCKEDFEKVKALEGFSEENAIQTSYTDWIEFICQPERLNPENVNLPTFECSRCHFCATKYRTCYEGYIKCPECHQINICDSLNSMET